MTRKEKVLKELNWIGARATMRTIKPRIKVSIAVLETKIDICAIETELQGKEND